MSSPEPEPIADVVPFPGSASRSVLFPEEPEGTGGSAPTAASRPVVEQVGRTVLGMALLVGDAAGQVARRAGEAAARTAEESLSGVVSAVVGRIDLEPIVNQVVDRIDFDPIISKVVSNLDMGPIIDDVMSEVRMSSLVMDATGGLTTDLVGDVRERGAEADALVERLVGKVLRRRLAALPELGLPPEEPAPAQALTGETPAP